jgi:hypothetical protein
MVGSRSGIQESPYARLGIFCTQGYRQAKIDRASLTARNSPSPNPAWPYGTETRGAFVPCYIPGLVGMAVRARARVRRASRDGERRREGRNSQLV